MLAGQTVPACGMTHLLVVVQLYNALQNSNDIGLKGLVDVETVAWK
jgi:hypothetical protein